MNDIDSRHVNRYKLGLKLKNGERETSKQAAFEAVNNILTIFFESNLWFALKTTEKIQVTSKRENKK
jgi:hypothetical protein